MGVWRSSKDVRPGEEPINRLMRWSGTPNTPAAVPEAATDAPSEASTEAQAAPEAQAVAEVPATLAEMPPPIPLPAAEVEVTPRRGWFEQAPAAPALATVLPSTPPSPPARAAAEASRDGWTHTEWLARSIVGLGDLRAAIRAIPAEALAARLLDAIDTDFATVGQQLASQIGTAVRPPAAAPGTEQALERVEWLVAVLDDVSGVRAEPLGAVRRALRDTR
jgi:hypothetical protein